jgi:hypothetical protein
LSRVLVTIEGVWIGWLDILHLHIQLVTTSNTALSLIYTLHSSPLHTLGFSVFTSRILAADLYQSHCNCSTHEVFFAQPSSFLSISSQSFDCHHKRLSQLFQLASDPCYIDSGWIQQNLRFHRYSSKMPRLLLAYSLPRESVYRVVT